MSDLLLGSLWSFSIAGLVLLSNSAVQLSVRKKTGPWKEGGASLLAGAIILGVSVFVGWLAELLLVLDVIPFFLIVGLVLAFNGVVQLSVRKKTGPWKEGGASLLAGAIITGVSVFVVWLRYIWLFELWLVGAVISFLLIVGLVLAFNGVVQLSVRKKTGPWKEGGASLLAGAIILGVLVFVGWSTGLTEIWSTMLGSPRVLIWQCFLAAGLVLLFNSVVQLCVRKKKGPWKEGGAGLLAGIIVAGVPIGVAIAFSWL
jgi:predicted phage tail protein